MENAEKPENIHIYFKTNTTAHTRSTQQGAGVGITAGRTCSAQKSMGSIWNRSNFMFHVWQLPIDVPTSCVPFPLTHGPLPTLSLCLCVCVSDMHGVRCVWMRSRQSPAFDGNGFTSTPPTVADLTTPVLSPFSLLLLYPSLSAVRNAHWRRMPFRFANCKLALDDFRFSKLNDGRLY